MITLDEPGGEATSVERIEVFSLNGTSYTVPAEPSAAFALRYLGALREHGADAGVDLLLHLMLGEDGYAALVDYDALTEAQLLTVFQVCLDLALGVTEGPKDG